MVPLFLPDTQKQDEFKAQSLHQPDSVWKVIRSGWGCWRVSLKQPRYSHFTFVVLFLQVCGRSSKLPSSLVVILLFQSEVWAVFSTFVTVHITLQGENRSSFILVSSTNQETRCSPEQLWCIRWEGTACMVQGVWETAGVGINKYSC